MNYRRREIFDYLYRLHKGFSSILKRRRREIFGAYTRDFHWYWSAAGENIFDKLHRLHKGSPLILSAAGEKILATYTAYTRDIHRFWSASGEKLFLTTYTAYKRDFHGFWSAADEKMLVTYTAYTRDLHQFWSTADDFLQLKPATQGTSIGFEAPQATRVFSCKSRQQTECFGVTVNLGILSQSH